MKAIARLCGIAALAATIVPPALFMLGMMPLDTMKAVMFLAALVWFGAAPWWMRVG